MSANSGEGLQAFGHDEGDVFGDSGAAGHEVREVGFVEGKSVERGLGDDGGGAGLAGKEGHLAAEIARAEFGDFLGKAGGVLERDGGAAGEEDEHGLAGVSLAEDEFAAGKGEGLEAGRKEVDFLLGEGAEEGDMAKGGVGIVGGELAGFEEVEDLGDRAEGGTEAGEDVVDAGTDFGIGAVLGSWLGEPGKDAIFDVFGVEIENDTASGRIGGHALDGGGHDAIGDGGHDLAGVDFVVCGEFDEVAPFGGDESDGGFGEDAIGDEDDVAIGGGDGGVAETDVVDPSGAEIGADPGADFDFLFEFEGNAAGEVAEEFLQGEADDGSGDGGGGDEASDIDAETGEESNEDGGEAEDGDHVSEEAGKAAAAEEAGEEENEGLDGGDFQESAGDLISPGGAEGGGGELEGCGEGQLDPDGAGTAEFPTGKQPEEDGGEQEGRPGDFKG